MSGIGLVGAEGAAAERGCEMGGELGVRAGDLVVGGLERLGDGHARALGVGGAGAAAARGLAQLVKQRLALLLQRLEAPEVVVALGLRDLLVERLEASAVGRAGLRVDRLARSAEAAG